MEKEYERLFCNRRCHRVVTPVEYAQTIELVHDELDSQLRFDGVASWSVQRGAKAETPITPGSTAGHYATAYTAPLLAIVPAAVCPIV